MLKLGILGSGMIVRELMGFIQKLHFEKVYILGRERSKERTEQMVREHHLTGSFYDYEKLLSSDADVIYVALPNFLHYEFAERALECGKHVILEKPFTVTYAEAKEIAEIARKRRLYLFEAVTNQYNPNYDKMKELLPRLGDIKLVAVNFSQYSSRYDNFKKGIVSPSFDPKNAGGALMDLNVYNIHAIVGLFGKPWEVRYEANMERGIDTSGVLTLDYGDFKAVAIGAKDCKAPVRCTIQGTKGCFVVPKPMSQMDGYELQLNSGETVEYRVEKPENRLYYEFAEFERIIREKDREKEEEMLKISGIVSEILEEARRQNRIFTRFPVMLPAAP